MNILSNKTQMTRLVTDKLFLFPVEVDMASGRALEFLKEPPMYSLMWAKKGRSYKAFLAPVMGHPVLSLTIWQDGERIFRDHIRLTPAELKQRRMLP